MEYTIETEREDDERWLAEVLEVRGAMAYGATKAEAIENARKVADEATADTTPLPDIRQDT